MESAFPRGGAQGGSSAPQGKAKVGDALFGSARLQRIEVVGKKKSKTSGPSSGKAGPSIAGLGGLLSGGKAAIGADGAKVGLGHTRMSANNKKLKIEPVILNRYTPGSLALGYVLQVNDSRAMISLPGGVVGTVELAEVSDVCFRAVAAAAAAAPSGAAKKRRLSHGDAKNLAAGRTGAGAGAGEGGREALDLRALLKPMQPVRCFVLGLVGGNADSSQQTNQGSFTSSSSSSSKQGSARTSKSNSPHLALSLRASHINKSLSFKHLMPGFALSGALVSKEDHGWVVSAGIRGVSFFLPSSSVPAAVGELVIGEFCVLCPVPVPVPVLSSTLCLVSCVLCPVSSVLCPVLSCTVL